MAKKSKKVSLPPRIAKMDEKMPIGKAKKAKAKKGKGGY